MGGVRHEVFTDLFELVLCGHVADDDTGVGFTTGWRGELRCVDDPGVEAAIFEIAAWGGLLGQDDAGLDGFAGGKAAEQGICEAGLKEGFSNRSVDDFPCSEERAGCFIGEADVGLGIDEEECVAESIEQEVSFIACFLKITKNYERQK
jgi:hypothetical protein